jgi:hypothetical protein
MIRQDYSLRVILSGMLAGYYFNLSIVSVVLSMVTLFSTPALAGPYSDEMSKCFVNSTTTADKNSLMKWYFAVVALHPAVKSIANVTQAQRTVMNRDVAKLFERLLTKSCKNEAQQAIKYEGSESFSSGFRTLSEVAARGLFTDPSVSNGIGEFSKFLDQAKIEETLKQP